MATLAIQQASKAGTIVTLVAAAGGGDKFPAAPDRALRVKNADATATVVTIVAQKACNQGVLHDNVVSVAAGEERTIGGLNQDQYVDAQGLVNVTYSKVTSLTVAAVKT